jgi:AraC family transcriptional activator of pobA
MGEWIMTYPQELWENTNLRDAYYPINMFRNVRTSLPKDAVVLGMHWHEHFEIIVMLGGRAVFHIDSKPYEVEPGDILIVPAGGLHVGYTSCEGNVEYVAIVFNASLLSSHTTADPVHAQYMAPFLEGSLHFPVKLDHGDESTPLYFSLLQQTIQEFELKNRAYELAVKTHLYLLFTLLSRQFLPTDRSEKTAVSFSRNMDRFKELLLYLKSHYTDNITVEQAAKRVNLNPFHFCKMFKKTTGRTLIEYVNLIRMNEAEKLLKETDSTITEIAGQVGCGNPNYFTKMFKQYKGMSPSQMRK